MPGRALDALSAPQRALLTAWLPKAVVVEDLSWGLVGTTVLRLRADAGSYVVKAGDDADRHIAREIAAHLHWLRPWSAIGKAAHLVHHDVEAKILLTSYLPGGLVEGSAWERVEDVYQQAGALLALLHDQPTVTDDGEYEQRQQRETLDWLERPHRIAADVVRRLADEVARWPSPPSVLVPTHGDWHPRNWLVERGEVCAIDFGRAGLRPALTDLARLAARQFRSDPALERAFFAGYGTDPCESAAWRRLRIREAVGTAGWAFAVGDELFEQQGHRMIAEVLGE